MAVSERESEDRSLAVRCTVGLVGTFLLTLVAAGPGVINAYAATSDGGGEPIGQAAAVIAPGALVMAFIYAWGPLSGFHVNPAVTLAFAGRGVFDRRWVVPYVVAQFAGCLAIVFVVAFDLGPIAMMASAAFLIVYAAVNVAHLRVRKETGAKAPLVIASLIACIVMFVLLMVYVVANAPAAASVTLLATLAASFAIEVADRRRTGRRFRTIEEQRG